VPVEDTKRGRKFQRINVVAGRIGGNIVAPLCYAENITSASFVEWFRASFIKAVPRGTTVIMDNASFHPRKKLKNLCRRHGVRLLFLPVYSPDYNPIEKTWANMKRALVDIIPHCEDVPAAIYRYFDINTF
jgi:transposase